MLSPVRVTLVVPAETEVQVAPLWAPLYHQVPEWFLIVSRAPVPVTRSARSIGPDSVLNSACVVFDVSSLALVQPLSEYAL